MDQRSRVDELRSSRSTAGKDFANFRDAGREDCLFSEQDHSEFPVQKRRSKFRNSIRHGTKFYYR